MTVLNTRCRLWLVGIVSLAAGVMAWPLNAKADEEGWVDLLSGGELSKHWTTQGNWTLDDQGVITLTPRPGEKGWSRFDAYLWLNDKYDDFEIMFDYKVQKGGNSGFYFNVGNRASPVAQGIEVQIYASHGKKGKRLTDHDSGGIIPGIPPQENAAKPQGEWNTFHITVQGEQLTVKLNGQLVNEVNLASHPRLKNRPKSGSIGFQDHALPLALRNIKIRGTIVE